jgi:hypothetical protein
LGVLSRVGAGNDARGGRAAVEAAVCGRRRRFGSRQAGALERKGAVGLALGGAWSQGGVTVGNTVTAFGGGIDPPGFGWALTL